MCFIYAIYTGKFSNKSILSRFGFFHLTVMKQSSEAQVSLATVIFLQTRLVFKSANHCICSFFFPFLLSFQPFAFSLLQPKSKKTSWSIQESNVLRFSPSMVPLKFQSIFRAARWQSMTTGKYFWMKVSVRGL